MSQKDLILLECLHSLRGLKDIRPPPQWCWLQNCRFVRSSTLVQFRFTNKGRLTRQEHSPCLTLCRWIRCYPHCQRFVDCRMEYHSPSFNIYPPRLTRDCGF